MALDSTTTPKAATPVTILMQRDTFYRWLREIQRVPEGATCDEPDFRIEECTGPASPYFEVEGYIGTSEGTVIASHYRNSDDVKVMFRIGQPGESLMHTVRMMLVEESEVL